VSDPAAESHSEIKWAHVFSFVKKHSEVVGLVVLAVNYVLWFFDLLPAIVALPLGGAGGLLVLIGIFGQVFVSNSESLTSLGSLTSGRVSVGAPVVHAAPPVAKPPVKVFISQTAEELESGKVIDRRFRRLSSSQKERLVRILSQTEFPPPIRLRYRNIDMEACQFVQDFRDVFNEAGWTRIVNEYQVADYDTRRGLFIETMWNHIPPTGAHTLANALKDIGLTVTIKTTRNFLHEDDVVFTVGGIED
jgi:hypothetical protein